MDILNLFVEAVIDNALLLTEGVDRSKVDDAIKNRYRVKIKYNDGSKTAKTEVRTIEVYTFGLSKAGNPVIRAYQPFGDSKRGIPHWKFFRLDRVLDWQPTKFQFWTPIEEADPEAPAYNKDGDKTMSVVYNKVDFSKKPAKIK